MTITQTIEIPADHRLVIEVPREVPAGPALVAFTPVETEPVDGRTEPKKEREFGCAKGQFRMADDFDAPLEIYDYVRYNHKYGNNIPAQYTGTWQ